MTQKLSRLFPVVAKQITIRTFRPCFCSVPKLWAGEIESFIIS